MAVEMNGIYMGDLHCDITHGPSGTKISTDAPKDNMGRGEAFSPTDLMGVALGACIITTMGIVARRDNVPFEGATFHVTKVMNDNPRKIAELTVNLKLPSATTPEYRKKLEHIAHTCPVHRSIHPDVKMPINFDWSL